MEKGDRDIGSRETGRRKTGDGRHETVNRETGYRKQEMGDRRLRDCRQVTGENGDRRGWRQEGLETVDRRWETGD